MDEPLPLSALLSFALVAFTIEADNAAESLIPHTTTRQGKSTAAGGPWLTSMAMWLNCLKHLPDEGIPVRELARRARTETNLNGMMRWGYIFMSPSPMDTRAKPPLADWLVRATAAGKKARQVWEPLPAAIERRWEKRFGREEIEQLRAALRALAGRLDPELPNCMPILGFGLCTERGTAKPGKADHAERGAIEELSIVELLARALVAFAIEFEGASKLSLSLCQNVLRVLDEKGVRVRDLPTLSGVSKESIAMALGFMQKRGLCTEEQEGAGKSRVVKLTHRGGAAQLAGRRMLREIEAKWDERFGEAVKRVRGALEKLLGDSGRDQTELIKGTEPAKGCWRAELPRPQTLPWFPMVLHRGGYPDGS